MSTSQNTKIDKSFKFINGAGYTTTSKTLDNEDAPSGFLLVSNDVFVQDAYIPGTPPGSTTALVHVYNPFQMVKDTSSPTNLAWYASTDGSSLTNMRASRVGNWINPKKFGQGYTIQIWATNNVNAQLQQIFFSDASAPVFDYKTGILTFDTNPLTGIAGAVGIQIIGYVYVGKLLSQYFDSAGDILGASSTDPNAIHKTGDNFTGIITGMFNNLGVYDIGTTPNYAIILDDSTPATSLTNQYSPTLGIQGNFWTGSSSATRSAIMGVVGSTTNQAQAALQINVGTGDGYAWELGVDPTTNIGNQKWFGTDVNANGSNLNNVKDITSSGNITFTANGTFHEYTASAATSPGTGTTSLYFFGANGVVGSPSFSGQPGGLLWLQAGNGGDGYSTTKPAGMGGNILIQSGNGGTDEGYGTLSGIVSGGFITIQGGTGTTSISSSHSGGGGGQIAIIGGTAGSNTSSSGQGGIGGELILKGGPGGQAHTGGSVLVRANDGGIGTATLVSGDGGTTAIESGFAGLDDGYGTGVAGDIDLICANGNATTSSHRGGDGGNVLIDSGWGGAGGGVAGKIYLLAGAGGAADSNNDAGHGGHIELETLPGGDASSTHNSSLSGHIFLTTGTGGNGTNASHFGSASGDITFTTGAGGNFADLSSVGGNSGVINLITGKAGKAKNSGNIVLTVGTGGDGYSSTIGGLGGNINLTSGQGGIDSGTGGAGNGGLINIIAGPAGADTGTHNAAQGGSVNINGGSALGTGQFGGGIVLDAGHGLAGDGNINIGTTYGNVIRVGNGAGATIVVGNTGGSDFVYIGDSASSTISFFGATGTTQPNTTGTTSGYSDSGATVVHTAGTFTGNTGSTAYTIGDIVFALKKLGLLAS